MNHCMDIAFITDNNFVIPALTAIYSVIRSKSADSILNFHIITADLSDESVEKFKCLETEAAKIFIYHATAKNLRHLHPEQNCSATPAALLKFNLPLILSHLDRVLYLDADIIVKKPLDKLFHTDLADQYAAVVLGSTPLTWQSKDIHWTDHYFNSGVMLLNLKKMRQDKIPERLIAEKEKMKDLSLMDQDVLNLVFGEQIILMPLSYNCTIGLFMQSFKECSTERINALYRSDYLSLAEMAEDAAVIHYASKIKPWKGVYTPYGEPWLLINLEMRQVIFGEDVSKSEAYNMQYTELQSANLQMELQAVYNSRSYRLGNLLLKPLHILSQRLKKTR